MLAVGVALILFGWFVWPWVVLWFLDRNWFGWQPGLEASIVAFATIPFFIGGGVFAIVLSFIKGG